MSNDKDAYFAFNADDADRIFNYSPVRFDDLIAGTNPLYICQADDECDTIGYVLDTRLAYTTITTDIILRSDFQFVNVTGHGDAMLNPHKITPKRAVSWIMLGYLNRVHRFYLGDDPTILPMLNELADKLAHSGITTKIYLGGEAAGQVYFPPE